MMKYVYIAALLFFCSCQSAAQPGKCAVAFYNVENLFDTKDDPATHDEEFTPGGKYRYTEKVYAQKLHNIATVIDKFDAALVGLAEIENETVLKDLAKQPELSTDKYKYVWYNSPDPRGIDVALLYNPKSFKVLRSSTRRVNMKGLSTRDVLYVTGVLIGDTVHVLVNHWPSRGEGLAASKPKRAAAAQVNRSITDSILKRNPAAKIIIMGDMNDNPADESIARVLGAGTDTRGKLYNPWIKVHKSGKGTSVYHKQWDHFDQIIISSAWLQKRGLKYNDASIFDDDFIRNKGYEDAYPLRSFNGYRWNNGYSDHLPVIIHFTK